MKSFFRDAWRDFMNQHARRPGGKQPGKRNLAIEPLEDRRLLAIMTTPSADANALRDDLLSPGIVTPGNATVVQGNGSSGFFTGGAASIGIEEGVILATGPIFNAEPPNVDTGSSGIASGVGDPALDAEFGVNTTDTTALEFQFNTATGRVSFNYVFASEEYNEFANTAFNDAFALFIDGVNIALVPGTMTPVSVNNVNGGNPLGVGAVNPEFYNNNDPGDGGLFLDELGYDGFTDILLAEIEGLTIGTHTVRMTISDTADQAFDSGVFIEAGSFTDITPLASISGTKWDDLDADGVRDPNEPGLAGWTIFIDQNGNNALDPGEPTTVTDVLGNYAFGQLAPGTYVVGEVLQPFWVQTFPAAPGTQSVEAGVNDQPLARVNIDFGNNLTGLFGVKFSDNNGNGQQDGTEPGLPNWTIFLDTNNNGILDTGEPETTTTVGGIYAFPNLAPGVYTVREVLRDGFRQTAPAEGFYRVTLTANSKFTALDFGNLNQGGLEGFKWHDLNQNGAVDPGEPGLENWTIYADLDNSGDLSPGEPSALTAADGTYQLLGLDPGTYTVREVPMTNWEQTFPGGDGSQTVTVFGGVTRQNIRFGNKGFASVTGTKFNDLNNNGAFDAGEPGVGGFYIYVDLNNDSKAGASEPGVFSKADGRYTITRIEPGQYTVREVIPPGWQQTTPASGFYTISLAAGDAAGGLAFGNVGSIDWGDAPAIYPTLSEDDGANHAATPGFHLGPGGSGVLKTDAELDGQPHVAALGDDLNLRDDEDGVILPATFPAGTTVPITVIGSIAQDTLKGKFSGWFDFNADGDWDDPGERVFYDMLIKSGDNELLVDVPADAIGGPTYARFRITTEWNIPAFGDARDGEVEDYVVNIDNPASPFGTGAIFLGTPTDSTLSDLDIVGPTTLFEVVAGETGILSALATFDHDEGNIDLAVYDGAGNLLGQSSSVTDEERVDIEAVYGERYLIKVFGSNPSVDFRVLNLLARDNGDIVIVANRAAVSAELTAPPRTTTIPCTDCIELAINDVTYMFDAPTDFVMIGGDDDDDLTINSNGFDDDITFREGSVKVKNLSFNFDASYIPDIFVDAEAGEDTVRFFNLTGPDTFTSSPEFSARSNYTYTQRVDGADRVLSYAVEFEDTVTVTGTALDDRFVGRESSSFLVSDTFFVYLNNYKKVTVDANGGDDTATVSDSAGDDLAVGNGNFSYIDAYTFRIDMRDFERVNFSSTTGNDAASFFGDASDDLMSGNKIATFLMTDDHFFYAADFPTVIVDGRGGNDRAFFRGTIGEAETYVAREQNAFLRANDFSYFIRGKGFETNRGFGGVEDTAVLYDTTRPDTYVARPEFVYILNSAIDMLNYAEGFGKTKTFATPGSGDTANAFDGPGNDLLFADDSLFFLKGVNYLNQVDGFDRVVADGNAGGVNTAVINGITYTLVLVGPWV